MACPFIQGHEDKMRQPILINEILIIKYNIFIVYISRLHYYAINLNKITGETTIFACPDHITTRHSEHVGRTN